MSYDQRFDSELETLSDTEERLHKGKMTVQEAGRMGGKATSESHGREFYKDIGHRGGQRVKELINHGKQWQEQHQEL